ncbi:MAG: Hpt domain-containing protein [Aquabacterium sp.]|nr:Hpt domain-containing protein [Aquabacterium sp.]
MDSLHQDASQPSDDLSALAWVHEELRKSLDVAHKALHRCLKDATSTGLSDMDSLDPAILRTARQQIHQGVGALELSGLQAGATLLRASEAVVQKFVNRPQSISEDAVRDIEKASFALLDYISRRLSGRPVSAMALFPQYEALIARVGSVLPRPTDLWGQDWPSVSLEAPLAPPDNVLPRAADAATVDDFETGLLSLLRRNQPADAVALADLCASLASGATARAAHRESATWMLASGFLEGLAGNHVPLSVHAKRVLSSLLSQLRVLVKGQATPSDRLANELLFFCAQAAAVPVSEHSVLARVRRTFGLEKHKTVDLQSSTLGRYDPAWVAQAIKRVSGAKDGWSAVAAGELLRLGGLNEQFSLVSDSLKRLFLGGDVLADALTQAVQQTVQTAKSPEPSLAMEVATSLLYLEASLEDGDFDNPDQQPRIQRLAERIDGVSHGQAAQALESWQEDLYRRVSDRQTIGSVVQELRATLSDCEKHIDQFFRQPTDNAPLVNVSTQLQSMRGVLAVLGLDLAAQTTVHMRDAVDHLLQSDVDLDQAALDGVFDRLATNLGALGFLIDMMGVQPALAKSLFTLDEATGVLSPVMGREKKTKLTDDPVEAVAHHVHQVQREEAQAVAEDVVQAMEREDAPLSEVTEQLQKLADTPHVQEQAALAEDVAAAQAALQSAQDNDNEAELLAAREQVSLVLSGIALPELDDLSDATPNFPAQALLAPTPAVEHEATGLEDDDDMRDIFLEESREVIDNIQQALVELHDDPASVGALTTVRRGFHTLKGSSRMVGLKAYGEAAWSCEQLYNTWMASQAPASQDLLAVTADVARHFAAWTDAISARQDAAWSAQPVIDVADAMRLHGRRQVLADGAETETETEAQVESIEEPTELDLLDVPEFGTDTVLDLEAQPADTVPQALSDIPESEHELIVLDLGEPATMIVETIHAPEAPALLSSSSEIEPEDTPLDFTLQDPKEVVLLDEADQTQPGSLDGVDLPLDLVDEQVKIIGPLRISIPLFNIYLNEADEQSRRLCTTLNEWALELHRPVSDESVALAHSLAGNSATVGYTELSQLARLLEHALLRSQTLGPDDAQAVALFNEAADEIRNLLHQFAAGFLKTPSDDLMRRLEWHDHEASRRIEARSLVSDLDESPLLSIDPEVQHPHLRLVRATPESGEFAPLDPGSDRLLGLLPSASAKAPSSPSGPVHWDDESEVDAQDNVDPDLFPIFEEEALELLPQLSGQTRQWLAAPDQPDAAAACLRTLHTFKGGARLAGAMRLGELAHRMESTIERLVAFKDLTHADVAPLEARVDRLIEVFEALREDDAQSYEQQANQPLPPVEPVEPVAVVVAAQPTPDVAVDAAVQLAVVEASSQPVGRHAAEAKLNPIDWDSLPNAGQVPSVRIVREAVQGPSQASVRVRPQLLDRLVNHAGEVSITRTRLQSQVGQIRGSLTDLTDNLDRLRQHLRDIELQAETQLSTRMEAARAASQGFDPLEFDRYTRFQELTRMMAESVNDVATVQRTLQRNLETAEDQLAAQARLTRDLQDDLLRTRMIEFDGLSDRLYRVVRQAAKETGKQVRLDIVGGAIEVDRGVLERMTGSFEHLVRNCITHGIESPEDRLSAGKDHAGLVTVSLRQEGNEVSIEFRDDGAGLNLPRIRAKAAALGMLTAGVEPTDAELSQLIFTPGFSTAEAVTELAGRGIGMDVVRSEVNAMGGRIETSTEQGVGTSFQLILPLTTAVTKVVMLRCGEVSVAVPTHLIEMVRRARPQEVEQAYAQGTYALADMALPFYWLGALLNFSPIGTEGGRTLPIVVIRSAQQRIALHVDEVLGNQEVVVKNLGPQLARLPGLAGMTLLASGAVSLIYNPVALAAVYGDKALDYTAEALTAPGVDMTEWLHPNRKPLVTAASATLEVKAPLVMVVDDSLTVRRVTQRLLAREGYRVTLAKDGVEALAALATERPAMVLSDIEMPRMDGFELVSHIRADQRLAGLPVIMITSRIAQKHRDYAMELGVNHYLGKPYGEDELLALVARYATAPQGAPV